MAEAAEPQQAGHQHEKLEVDGDVPEAGRQRVEAEQTLQQEDVRQPLSERGAGRDGVVVHPVVGNGCADDGDGDRREIGNDEAHIALPDQRQRGPGERLAIGRQSARRQKAADHQKDLDRHPRIVVQPVDRRRRHLPRRHRQRPIGRQMVENDKLRGDGLEGVDQRHAVGELTHLVDSTRYCCGAQGFIALF